MNNERRETTVEADLGLSTSTNRPIQRVSVGGGNLATIAEAIQREVAELLVPAAPRTGIGRIVDAVLPGPVRRAQIAGERRLVETEIRKRTNIHDAFARGQVRQAEAIADAYGRACELQAEEEVASRALDTTGRIGTEVFRTGADFDRTVDSAIDRARSLQTETSRLASAERIERMIDLRSAVEEEVREQVVAAIRGSKRSR